MERSNSETLRQSSSPPSLRQAGLRRSLLFVPGGEARKLERANSADADEPHASRRSRSSAEATE